MADAQYSVNGSASLMRGKSPTCRRLPPFFSGSLSPLRYRPPIY